MLYQFSNNLCSVKFSLIRDCLTEMSKIVPYLSHGAACDICRRPFSTLGQDVVEDAEKPQRRRCRAQVEATQLELKGEPSHQQCDMKHGFDCLSSTSHLNDSLSCVCVWGGGTS